MNNGLGKAEYLQRVDPTRGSATAAGKVADVYIDQFVTRGDGEDDMARLAFGVRTGRFGGVYASTAG